MNSLLRMLPGLLAALLFYPALALAGVAQMLQRPEVHTVVISPDGAHLAMVQSDDDKDTAIIFRRAGMQIVTGVSSEPGERFSTITWANADRLLIEPARGQGSMSKPRPSGAILALALNGERRRLLPPWSDGSIAPTSIVNLLPDDAVHVLAVTEPQCELAPCREGDEAKKQLVKLNVESGGTEVVGAALDLAGYYVSDPTGAQVMVAGKTEDDRVAIYQLQQGRWQAAAGFDLQTEVGAVPLAIDSDGTVFALANKLGTAALYQWDLHSGQTKELHRDSAADVDAAIRSYGGRRLLAVRSDPGFPRWHYLQPDDAFASTHKALRAAHPDSDVWVTSFTADGGEMVVRVHGDRRSGDFYLVNIKTRHTELLAAGQPWLESLSPAKLQPLEVTARDDFRLKGYVAVPETPSPHPLVVFVHDPFNSPRVEWAWDPQVQYLVAHGYAVLMVNYRGSRGFGQPYAVAGAEHEGNLVQRDIADASQWAVEHNFTTAQQMCIYGRGYGAFAAAKALATHVDLYRCAVAINGFYDLVRDYQVPERPPVTAANLLYPNLRLDLDDTKRTPWQRMAYVKAPLLLIGESVQTTRWRDTMISAGKTVEWLGSAERAEELEAVVAFLDRSLSTDVIQPPVQGAAFTLSNAQAVAFQQIVEKMKRDTKALSRRRALSVPAIRRQLRKIIDQHDAEVRAIVSDAQWALYEPFKIKLAAQLEADLDIVKVQ